MLANQRANKLFLSMKQDMLDALFCTVDNEGSNVRDVCGQFSLYKQQAAFTYIMMIYKDITNPYNRVQYNLSGEPDKPLSMYLEKYEYEEMKSCMSCIGIDLDKHLAVMKLEEIILNDNDDSEVLLDETIVSADYVCQCTKTLTSPLVTTTLL